MGIEAQKIAGAILLALILVTGLNLLGDALISPHAPEQPPIEVAEEGAPPPEAEQPAAEEAAAPAGGFATLVAAASPEEGEKAAKICVACHTFEQGAAHKIGPNLHGVVGRDIASAEGYAYSDALKGLEGEWSDEKLGDYLAKPTAFAPGTKMTFAGVKKEEQRAAIVAYLRSLGAERL